jgi:hypothetical protein
MVWLDNIDRFRPKLTPVLRPWIRRGKAGFFFLVLSTQTLGRLENMHAAPRT